MPTIRQRKAAELMIENMMRPTKTKGMILAEAGYGKQTQRRPFRVLESEGYKEALNELLARVKATKEDILERMAEIMHGEDKRSSIAAAAEINKMLGNYAPSKVQLDSQLEERKRIMITETREE